MTQTVASPTKLAGQVFTREQLIELNPRLKDCFNQLGVRSNTIPGTRGIQRFRRKDVEAACRTSGISIPLPKASTRVVLLSPQETERNGDLIRLLQQKKIVTDFLFTPQVGELMLYIEQNVCDMVILDHSIGRPQIESMCKLMRDRLPVAYLVVLKPQGATRRWLDITDEEMIATPERALETIIARIGIAA